MLMAQRQQDKSSKQLLASVGCRYDIVKKTNPTF